MNDPLRDTIDWNEDCLRWRGKVLTGKYKHWCHEWDGLPVDETSQEWNTCTCWPADAYSEACPETSLPLTPSKPPSG